MAHFAKLDENNKVLEVVVVNNNDCLLNGVEDEATGISFLQKTLNWPNWKQTSYNRTFRKNFAGKGSTYDPVNDMFVPAKPDIGKYKELTFNTTTGQWNLPSDYPTITTFQREATNEDGTIETITIPYLIIWDQENNRYISNKSFSTNPVYWNPNTNSWVEI